ncbi:MAG: NHLP-related RiPP peptide [Dokdonella sp.]|nr:NHLP-related RiPP peptide [Dokdonella sp.]
MTEAQANALLRRLADDDAFRKLFRKKPAKALQEIGVPLRTIVDLDSRCLCPAPLAPKKAFRAAVESFDRKTLETTMSMRPPKMKLR